MNQPDDPSNDPPPPPDRTMTEDELNAWLLRDPARADAMITVLDRHFEAKRGQMTPEEVEEVQRLRRQLQDELADFLVPELYNPLADRLRVLLAQEDFSIEEVDEVRMAEKKLKHLMDMSLALAEPRRTTVITTLLASQKQVQQLLSELPEG